ncbi:MAG: YbaK/EbsC family protein [Micropruina sp.]|uniref:aminoacyl-tRNA deacylase n=1 Tax=Micropruina sp. TaxID=2737536 RepID=UPI0039E53DC1
MNRVLQTLDAAGESYRVHTHPPIRGEADLHLTGLDWTTSVKTLAFGLPDGTVALVGVPGPSRVQYGAVARALGVSRSQLRPASADAVAALGMQPGGVSPVCADPGVVVLLDSSVPGMGSVYCGGGDPETTIELDAAALLRIAARPATADVIG